MRESTRTNTYTAVNACICTKNSNKINYIIACFTCLQLNVTLLYICVCVCACAYRMAHDDHRHLHNPRHMLDTARVCERMRVYVYLVDGLYRRAELNKHPHCLRVPLRARPHQRCPAAAVFSLRVLAGDYSIEANLMR
jgi:hypothetical protein